MDVQKKLDKIDLLTREGYNVRSIQYIQHSIFIFNEAPWHFALFTLILFWLPFLPQWITKSNWIGLITPLFTAPLSLGIFIVSKKIYWRQPFQFADFFRGYEIYKYAVGAHYLQLLFILLGFLLFIITGFYLAIAYSFVTCMITFLNTGSLFEIFERSRKLITKQWFDFLGFILLIGLLNLAGLLCLVVGLLITMPMSSIAIYLAYENIVGTEDDEETGHDNMAAEPPVGGEEN
jgi:hypothetical protein